MSRRDESCSSPVVRRICMAYNNKTCKKSCRHAVEHDESWDCYLECSVNVPVRCTVVENRGQGVIFETCQTE